MADKELVMELEKDILWLEQGCATEIEICEHIKQAIKTIIKHKETESPWHTGTPTEEGDYVVICEYMINNYMARTRTIWAFKNGRWDNTFERFFRDFKVIAWYGQKIEPYKEATE